MKHAVCSFVMVSLIAALLSACKENVSVCGGKGVCCGVAYTSSDNGDLKPTWHACRPSCDTCPPEGMSGSPVCPVDNPPGSACDVSRKMTWIWEKSKGFTSMTRSLRDIAAVLAPVSNEPAVVGGRRITSAEPDYCVKRCEQADSVSACPRFTIPNDPSAGVLSLIVDIAEGPPTASRTISISEVLSRFNVTAGLDKCARGDVVVDKGTVLNSGSACDATMQGTASDIDFNASLVTSAQVRADVAVAPGTAVFSPSADNFRLRLEDRMANSKWGGPIVVAARARKMEIATAIDGSRGRTCVALIPDVAEKTQLYQKVEALRARPAVIAEVADFLKDVTARNGIGKTGPQQRLSPDFPNLFPLSSAYRAGVAQHSGFSRDAMKFEPKLEKNGQRIALEDVLLIADVARCGEALKGKRYNDLAALLPMANAARPLSDELMRVREQRSGELILCRFGSELIDPGTSQHLANAFPIGK